MDPAVERLPDVEPGRRRVASELGGGAEREPRAAAAARLGCPDASELSAAYARRAAAVSSTPGQSRATVATAGDESPAPPSAAGTRPRTSTGSDRSSGRSARLTELRRDLRLFSCARCGERGHECTGAVDPRSELGRAASRELALEAGQAYLDSGELAPCGSGLVGHRAARPLYDAGARPQGRERADQGEPPVEIGLFGVLEVGRERAGLVERLPPDGDARDRPDEAPTRIRGMGSTTRTARGGCRPKAA